MWLFQVSRSGIEIQKLEDVEVKTMFLFQQSHRNVLIMLPIEPWMVNIWWVPCPLSLYTLIFLVLVLNYKPWHTPLNIGVPLRPTHEVDVPKSNIAIIWTPTFEWYVVRCGSKNGHQKCVYMNEVTLHAQKHDTILGSIINIIVKDLYDQLMSTIFFHFD